MKDKFSSIRGKELLNSKLGFRPGMPLHNAAGNVDPQSLGYQYTIQTTTQIRAQVVQQKFYKVAPAEFMPVLIGNGAWMESIKTNLVYDEAGPFEQGLTDAAQNGSAIPQVDVGTAPVTATINTWTKGYQYSTAEVQKALASNNWDVITAKLEALKRNWDLGIQKIAFLGLKDDDNTPGLLSSGSVNANTTSITQKISEMDAAAFQALVSTLLADFFTNSNSTALPNTFVLPMSDYLGLGAASSAQFPLGTKLEYLQKVFAQITGYKDFQIKGLAYSDQANNAGYWADAGTNRYVLYNNELEVLKMDIPVDMYISPAGTADNFRFQGVGAGQFSGLIFYRPLEALYFDWAE